ncbi:MAG: hypothetical protein ABI651_01120 [Verrucomicrobiota bacterium]
MKFNCQNPRAASGRSRLAKSVLALNGACWLLLALIVSGCATARHESAADRRPFVFQQDTLDYANQLVWEYHFDPATGQTSHSLREPPPTYSHHCFVVARSAKEFFEHARFDPNLPIADEPAYRQLIRRVVSQSPRRWSRADEKVVIPGYANLREFSAAQERLLQSECGGAWQSYFQRGHWRMIFPFARNHQARVARQLVEDLKDNRPPIVHIVCFPSLSINHAILLFDFCETDGEITFAAYDPNAPEQPTVLNYDRASRSFNFPRNAYFHGGRVDIYEVYHAWNY